MEINNQEQKSSDNLYLEKLEFNPELRKSWLNFFITNFRVVILLIALTTLWGVYSFLTLPRESSPEVKIPIALVVTTYPGASPSDIEELVTKKIETEMSGLKNIKKITSSSANSVSTIKVEFDAKADLDDSMRKLRDAVNNVKTKIPSDANDPIVKEISMDDQPIWTIAITGPFDGATLHKHAEDIKDELEKVQGVREVNIFGGDEKEFEIAYDPQKLTFYGLSTDQANQLVKAVNLAIPAGSFEGSKFVFPVRTDAKFYDEKRIASTPLFHTADGAIVYLSDIAKVREKNITRSVYSRISIAGEKPQEAVTISIVKKTGGSIIDTVEEAKKIVDNAVKSAPGLKYDTTVDMSKQIEKDFNQLEHDFTMTIILVGGILFLIVGLKEALVAGLAVPLVFFVTFGIMSMTGISLNFLSILSLLLSLGLLVDDAIVVVSATKQYISTGKFTPEEAVLLVLNDFKVVLTTTTLTTVWAFLPLLLASGIIGSYIKSIPITVSVTLIASLVVALMINHPLAAVLERIRLTKSLFWSCMAMLLGAGGLAIYLGGVLGYALAIICFYTLFRSIKWNFNGGVKKLEESKLLMDAEWKNDELIKKKLREQGSHSDDNFLSRLMHGIISFHKIIPIYEKYLRKVLETKKSRWTTLGATFGVFIIAMSFPILGIVPSEFFPASDYDYIYINITAPTGLKLDETNKIVQKVEDKLLKYKEIKNFSTIVGVKGSSGSLGGGGGSSSHLANMTLNLVDKDNRDIPSYTLSEKIRNDLKDINEVTITVETPRGGPPSGSAFEARIMGNDLQKLDTIAHELQPYLTSIGGVIDSDISLKDSPADYTFSLDPARLELYNLNASYVGSVLRTAISGTEVTTVIRDNKEIKVIARFDKEKIPTLESIQNLQIINNQKQPVFLKDVAKIELKPSVESISRIDQKRAVLLSANVDSKTRPNAVLTEFQKKIAKDYKLPDGYTIVYGGENEQNTESVISIIRAMAVAGLLIISTLIIQFNSFKKAMIVLATIPLALIGVFFGMAIARLNLTFPGLIGILALFGIVVKNAIILVDKMNLNIKSGIEFNESIVDACKSRLEAIFITSICTILGIIPVTLSNATWISLGSAIIFGLMLSSFFTLFIIPTLFMTFIRKDERV